MSHCYTMLQIHVNYSHPQHVLGTSCHILVTYEKLQFDFHVSDSALSFLKFQILSTAHANYVLANFVYYCLS